jgi:hypothetical protein
MGNSGAGISGRVEIHMPEIEARTLEEWYALFPCCPACGQKMAPCRKSWRGGCKPHKIGCTNKACKARFKGGLKENEW